MQLFCLLLSASRGIETLSPTAGTRWKHHYPCCGEMTFLQLSKQPRYDVHEIKGKKRDDTQHSKPPYVYDLRAFTEDILTSFYENHQRVQWKVTLDPQTATENRHFCYLSVRDH